MPRRDPIAAIEDRELRIAALAVRLYAETHPRPTQVNQRQAAEMLGVDPKTVQSYLRAGLLRLNGCGQLPIEAVDALRCSQFHDEKRAVKRGSGPTAKEETEEAPYLAFLKRRSRFGAS